MKLEPCAGFVILRYYWKIILTIHYAGAAAVLGQRLSFVTQSTCRYDYEVAVHSARGTRSTVSEGFHLHALVSRRASLQLFYCFANWIAYKEQRVR